MQDNCNMGKSFCYIETDRTFEVVSDEESLAGTVEPVTV